MQVVVGDAQTSQAQRRARIETLRAQIALERQIDLETKAQISSIRVQIRTQEMSRIEA